MMMMMVVCACVGGVPAFSIPVLESKMNALKGW